MRPIINYHGPLFHWLHRLAVHLGIDNVLLLWQAGVVVWLLVVSGLALTRRHSHLFTTLALTGVVVLRLPSLGLEEQNVDESQWIVSAATLVANPRFWLSVDGTTSGPLNVWPPALLYYLGLSLDYTTLRLWGLLTCVLPTVGLLLATFRRQFGERAARLAILPIASCLALTTDPDGVAFNSEQLPMTLLALSGYLLSRIFSRKNPHWGCLPILGLLLGCLPYTKLQATPIGLLVAIWVLAGLLNGASTTRSGLFGRVGGFIAGGLLPTGLLGLYLLATGLTDYAFRSYILTNLEYAQAGSWGAGTISWADRLQVRFPSIYGNMQTTKWFWNLTLGLGVAVLIQTCSRLPKAGPFPYRWWFTVSVCLVSIYAILQPGNPFAHYQWLSFVPVSWLIGLLVNQLLTGHQGVASDPLWACYFLAGIAFPGWLALSRPNPGTGQLVSDSWHSTTWAVSEAIRPYARPNNTLVVWGWANSIHVETGLLLGSRFIPLYFPVVAGPQQAYFLDIYRQDLLNNRPAVIVDAVRLHIMGNYAAYPIARYPAIQRILDTRYRLVKTVNGAKIYTLRP